MEPNHLLLVPSWQVELASCFQLDQFRSLLLPENNRPLEPSVLLALKELFNRSDTKTVALHLLSVDCQVLLRLPLNRFLSGPGGNGADDRLPAGGSYRRGDRGAEEADGRPVGPGAHHFATRPTAEAGLAGEVLWTAATKCT